MSCFVQELALLESLLREEPAAQWSTITACYNERRGELRKRTAASLEHLFARAEQSSMRRLLCARKLKICTAAELASFEEALKSKMIADDTEALHQLSIYATDVCRLAHIMQVDVISLLLELSAAIGSSTWLMALKEHEEIEAQVQQFRWDMQQQRRGRLTMSEVSTAP